MTHLLTPEEMVLRVKEWRDALSDEELAKIDQRARFTVLARAQLRKTIAEIEVLADSVPYRDLEPVLRRWLEFAKKELE